jgi:prolyl 4-hydroxylase
MPETHFDDSWKIWIWSNVDRGCDKDELFKILYDNGFGYTAIRDELNYEPSIDLDSIETPSAISDEPSYHIANARRVDSNKIEMYILDDFLTADECERLIEVMKPNVRPSTITNDKEPDKYFRTSKTCDLGRTNDPQAAEIDARICCILGLNPSYSEEMQGQLYDIGEEFKPHTDWFTPDTEEYDRFAGKQGQRTWTFMIYLNDVESGGETSFDNIGMMIRPKTGTAVFWNNLYADGQPNPDAIHHALPVQAGYKAVVTKWFRSNGEGDMYAREMAGQMPNITRTGFQKLTFTDESIEQARSYLEENRQHAEKEYQSLDYLDNDKAHPSVMVELPESIKQQIAEAVKPLIEDWAGMQVAFTCVYGIRCYRRGTTLGLHTDITETHILSAIINIEQDVDEEWPLQIEDNYFRTHEVFLKPGEILLYEGARLRHGRVKPLQGDSFCNVFVHFRPAHEK